MSSTGEPFERTLRGIGLSAVAYGLFSLQDAMVKWLVAGLAVPQVLFCRSVVIVLVILLVSGRAAPADLKASPNKKALLVRGLLIMLAWLLFYSAARDLGLAELTTIYFAAPIMVVCLAVVILKEKVDALRWTIVAIGFAGALLAAWPSTDISPVPGLMALLAALCWGLSTILVRLVSRTEKTGSQMLASNLLFAIVCGAAMPFVWVTPTPQDALLLIALGLAGGLGQYLLFESFRFAPASVVAPVEYVGLVWAFLLGYAIWNDVPTLHVFAGAGLILVSSLTLVWSQRRRRPAIEAPEMVPPPDPEALQPMAGPRKG
ncbi:MAG: DMT family transporter [Methylobacterium mesophilicum]|nr:DMT family transporter [Methylobacterium mesophilicum]